jgi:hypothetical protein
VPALLLSCGVKHSVKISQKKILFRPGLILQVVDSENARGVTEWIAMSAHPIINSSRMFFPAPRIRHAAFLDRQKKNYRLRRAGLLEVGFLPPSSSPTDTHPEIVAHIHPSVLPKLDDKNQSN